MWNEVLNKFLDGEDDINNADDNIKQEYVYYKRIISVIKLRTEYVPSQEGKRKFLNEIKRLKIMKRLKFVSVLGGIAAAFLILYFALFSPIPNPQINIAKKNLNAQNVQVMQLSEEEMKKLENLASVEQKEFEQTANNLELLQLINEGF